MAEIVITDYLGMLERSRLFDSSAKLQACYQEWQAERQAQIKPQDQEDIKASEESRVFAEWLIQHDYITQWQSDNIFAGKYKGFFLGKYKLLRSIGAGGMSSVYLAVHTILERQVAIKVLPKSRVTSDSSYLERFLLEAQAVAALDHPNIVRAYDVDTEGNSIYYLVMEYIDGSDLLSLVKKDGPMDIYRAAKFIRQAAEGLQHAHTAGLIHRDMKPANLLVDSDDNVHVLDLGLARFTDEKRSSLTLTYDENVLGTADYLAPEQARNSHNVDARADIYGLGCTLYYLLLGHVPFPEGTLAQRIQAHQTRMPTRIQDERPEVPDDLAEICSKMMAKDPNDRQQSAEEVADDLTRWLLEQGRRVEGFTGSLSELRRKKYEINKKKQDEILGDAQKELTSLVDIANLANLSGAESSRDIDTNAWNTQKKDGASESFLGNSTINQKRGKRSKARKSVNTTQTVDALKQSVFSTLGKMRQMITNESKKKSARNTSETRESSIVRKNASASSVNIGSGIRKESGSSVSLKNKLLSDSRISSGSHVSSNSHVSNGKSTEKSSIKGSSVIKRAEAPSLIAFLNQCSSTENVEETRSESSIRNNVLNFTFGEEKKTGNTSVATGNSTGRLIGKSANKSNVSSATSTSNIGGRSGRNTKKTGTKVDYTEMACSLLEKIFPKKKKKNNPSKRLK